MRPRWFLFLAAASAAAIPIGYCNPLRVDATAVGDADDLSVAGFASKLAVKAQPETLDKWQQEVEEELAKFMSDLRKNYPAPATRSSINTNAVYELADYPQKEFVFQRSLSRRIFDFQCTTDHTRVSVCEESLGSKVKVLRDPIKDAFATAKYARQLLENLHSHGSKLRQDVDKIAASSDSTLQALKGGVAAHDLKELEAAEAKAAAEVEATRKVVEAIYNADATAVKQTTKLGRLLEAANGLVEGLGVEANNVKKELRSLSLQFLHHVTSSGVEMTSSVDYMKQAEEAYAALKKAYQAGMAELRQRRVVLERVEKANETTVQFQDELKKLKHVNGAVSRISQRAKAAQEVGDVLSLQSMLTRLNSEKEKLRHALEAAKKLVTQISLERAELDAELKGIINDDVKQSGLAASQQLSTKMATMLETLTVRGEKAESLITNASRDIAAGLAKLLEGYSKAVKDSEAWLRQSGSLQKKHMAAVKTKGEEAAAAKQAADQFQERLMEDVAAAQARVAQGDLDWRHIDSQYSLESRGVAAKQLMGQAELAREAANKAVTAAQRFADTFLHDSTNLLPTLTSSEKLATDLANSAKSQQEWLTQQDFKGKDAIVAATEAATAGRRAEAARELANSSSALSEAVKARMEELKTSMQSIKVLMSPKLSPRSAEAPKKQTVEEVLSDMKEYGAKASDQVIVSRQHLKGARDMREKLEKVKTTLSGDIDALKKALTVSFSEALQKQSPTATGDAEEAAAAGVEGEAEAESSPAGGHEPGELSKLATVVERQVGFLLTVADEMKAQEDAAERAQKDAMRAVSNLRLLRLKATLQDDDDELQGDDAQVVVNQTETLSKKVIKTVTALADELEDIRARQGGVAALIEVSDEVLQQLAEVLDLAETRYSDLMATGVPQLEARMLSVQEAAERLFPERAAATASGNEWDHTTAAATEFDTHEKGAREVAHILSEIARDIVDTAHHVSESLKELQRFHNRQGLQGSEADNSQSRQSPVGAAAAGGSMVPRSLSAADPPARTLDALLSQAGDLAARAGEARNGVLNRLAHLDSLRSSGDGAPTPLPAALYTSSLTGTPSGDEEAIKSLPDDGGADAADAGKEDSNKGGGSSKVFLAIGLTGGILCLLLIACCFVYAHRKRAKKVADLKQGGSAATQQQNANEEGPPFFSPTLDFDEATKGAQSHDPVISDPKEDMNAKLEGVTVLPTTEVVMGDLEAAKVDTTKRQYFIDDHHTVALELSNSQPTGCRTPLAYVFSSTPTDMLSPRGGFESPVLNTPHFHPWEGAGQGRPGSEVNSSMPAGRQRLQTQQRRHSRRAKEYEDLGAELERELRTKQNGGDGPGQGKQ